MFGLVCGVVWGRGFDLGVGVWGVDTYVYITSIYLSICM